MAFALLKEATSTQLEMTRFVQDWIRKLLPGVANAVSQFAPGWICKSNNGAMGSDSTTVIDHASKETLI
jgi:hypothetical protein